MVKHIVKRTGKSPLQAQFEQSQEVFKAIIPDKLLGIIGGAGVLMADIEEYPFNTAKVSVWDEQPNLMVDSDRNFLEVSFHDHVPYPTDKRILFVDT